MCNEPLRTPFFTEHLPATAYARQRQISGKATGELKSLPVSINSKLSF